MQMMRAKCGKCRWVFDVVAIPMELGKAAHTMQERSACPMCGERRGAITAEPRALTPEESEHKRALLSAVKLAETL